jgi:hypothetical protein
MAKFKTNQIFECKQCGRQVKLPAPRGGASWAQLKAAAQALALFLYDA